MCGCVVKAGALYGDGEGPAFETAVQTVFVGKEKLTLPSDIVAGTPSADGVVPIVHVSDVGRLVKALANVEDEATVAGSTHAAVDASSMSVKEIYQTLVDVVVGEDAKYTVGKGSTANPYVAKLGTVAKPEASELMSPA